MRSVEIASHWIFKFASLVKSVRGMSRKWPNDIAVPNSDMYFTLPQCSIQNADHSSASPNLIGFEPTNAAWPTLQLMLLLLLTALTGCGGCEPSASETLSREELERQRKERREAIQKEELVTLPADSGTQILTAKPGHWYETQQRLKSTREDLQVVVAGNIQRGGKPTVSPGTEFTNEFTRRTILPKGQWKTVDMQYFVPFTGKLKLDLFSEKSNRLDFVYQIEDASLRTPILPAPEAKAANELDPHVFQFVVVGPNAQQYEYFSALDAIFWKVGENELDSARTRSYFVSLLEPKENKYRLPHSMLTMTATAVIVWDDVSEDDLSDGQKEAIIDWLHWGGQLIISGPTSWTRLQNSFLQPYLPVRSAESTELRTDDFEEISKYWAVEDRSEKNTRPGIEVIGAPLGGLRFTLGNRGQWLPHSGELVAESSVGRGRIAITSFPLREPSIFRWKYFSSFLSTGLLRRHPRTFYDSGQLKNQQSWAIPFASNNRDPRLHSHFRILSRDLPLSSVASQVVGEKSLESIIEQQQRLQDEMLTGASISGGAPQPAQNTAAETKANQAEVAGATSFDLLTDGSQNFGPNGRNENSNARVSTETRESMLWGIGGGSWNDFSGLSYQAVKALRRAAGIELPTRKTILYLVAGYLAVLVPLNWLVFKVIGRLEYAWIVAPILALIGVVVVTRVAQLDIGFARRNTELAVLEIHEDHPRGHLTRYLALYTSLSTNYAIDFAEDGSVALPLGNFSSNSTRQNSGLRQLVTAYGQSDGVTLEPLTVFSNSTEMLHAEQMIALGGGLQLGTTATEGNADAKNGAAVQLEPTALKNGIGFDLESVLLLRRTKTGELQKAWVGSLPSGGVEELVFANARKQSLWTEWSRDAATEPGRFTDTDTLTESGNSNGSGEGSTNIASTENVDDDNSLWIGDVLVEVALKTPLMPGQTRLVGYTDQRLGELSVKPAEDQFDGRCIVVAHLKPAALGDVRPDEQIWSRILQQTDDEPMTELIEPGE